MTFTKRKNGMNLTPRQQAFADYYLETLNGRSSYIRAGYKVKNNETADVNASRLLANEHVKAYVESKMFEKDRERVLSQDEILEMYARIARNEDTEAVIVTYKNRYEIVHKPPSFKDRLKALEAMSKIYALFTNNVKISGDVGVHIQVDYGEEESLNE